MAFIGTCEEDLATQQISGLYCEVCGHDDLEVLIAEKYFSFLFIRIWKLKDVSYLHCHTCKKATSEKEMSIAVTKSIAALKWNLGI